ncbi:ATP-binding protein [Thermophagus sp. OGC60D27]|uniref:ATP-binding protein n=1 Tax=Thermophagus sp. OGC60D27 TaxID=3458415 RepID=UPI0040375F31
MKELTILSGKGGAGKTSVAAALATVAENAVFCDDDVDAADLHLIFNPDIKETHRFEGGQVAVIDVEKCTNCGICWSYCRFDAIHARAGGGFYINAFQCEGCRLCERVCPSGAIHSVKNDNNFWFVSNSRFGPFVHAKMGAGEDNSGKLVATVRQKAREIAEETDAAFIINDGPPGIGCPAISSVSGVDAVLLVVEPTLSGLHDARRLVELTKSFHVPVYGFINKYDINPEVSKSIEKFMVDKGIPLLGRWNFDENIIESMVDKMSVVEYAPESLNAMEVKRVWKQLKELMGEG